MGLSTHVLDTAAGRPAAGVPVLVQRFDAAGGWSEIARAETDADGRVRALLEVLEAAVYRITFGTGEYLPDGFYPEASVVFRVTTPEEHHHVPLLLSPYGYTTYRGS